MQTHRSTKGEPTTAYAALPTQPAAPALAAVQDIIEDVLRIKGGAENWGGWSATPDVCDLIIIKLQTISAVWTRRNADHEAVVKQCAALASSHGQAPAGATPVHLDHIACIDGGELRYMAGRKAPAYDCELYAMPNGGSAPQLYAAPTTQPVSPTGDEFQPCPSCFGKGVEGDADDYGNTIDVTCGECNGSGRAQGTNATQPAHQQEAQEPDFWTVCAQYEGGDETGWIPLPGYSNETEHGVKNLVLQAARKEGYKGTVTGRLMELNWEIRPVYLAPWVAPQPSPAAQGDARSMLRIVADYSDWLDSKGRLTSFSTFVNEFGYEERDCKSVYEIVVVPCLAARAAQEKKA